jgi:hypothetical protein
MAFNSTETGLVSLTAKIAVSYILNERLSLQSGFEIVNMGQSTGVILYDLSASKRLRSAYLQVRSPSGYPVLPEFTRHCTVCRKQDAGQGG